MARRYLGQPGAPEADTTKPCGCAVCAVLTASCRRRCCDSKCHSNGFASGCWRGGGQHALSTFASVFHMLCSLETGKNRRLKQAKEEAQAEIEQYRLQREKEFKAKEAAVGLLEHSLLPVQPLSPKTASTCPENPPQGGTRYQRSTSPTAFL